MSGMAMLLKKFQERPVMTTKALIRRRTIRRIPAVMRASFHERKTMIKAPSKTTVAGMKRK